MHSPKQKNEEYNELEKEYKFARWFWQQETPASWNATKLMVTFLGGISIMIIGYVAVTILPITPIASLIAIGVLVAMVLLTNVDIRGAIIQGFIHRRKYEQTKEITAYDQLRYYFLENHDEVLFVENGRDLTAIGLFKLKAIPLVIKGNFERFIRSLYQQQIPIYWTYVQAPVAQGAILDNAASDGARQYYEEKSPFEFVSRMESRDGVWVVRLLFGTRRSVSAITDIEAKRLVLYQQLQTDLAMIHTAFISAYPHTRLELLHGKELEKAFSVTITGGGIPAFF